MTEWRDDDDDDDEDWMAGGVLIESETFYLFMRSVNAATNNWTKDGICIKRRVPVGRSVARGYWPVATYMVTR